MRGLAAQRLTLERPAATDASACRSGRPPVRSKRGFGGVSSTLHIMEVFHEPAGPHESVVSVGNHDFDALERARNARTKRMTPMRTNTTIKISKEPCTVAALFNVFAMLSQD